MILFIAIGSFFATFFGGLLAIKFKDKLHLVLGFSAGAIIGVSLLDLIPESLELSKNFWQENYVMLFVAIGFVVYMIFDRIVFSKCNSEDHHHRGRFGAGSFSFHSFLDGLSIGIAFGISKTVGIVVSSAVLAHDFSDGLNTASMILRHGGKTSEALKWVALDAVAPILGILATLIITIPQSVSGIILAIFAGLFLYIGASDLLPESHHTHGTKWTSFSTILGLIFIYIVVTIASV